MRPCRRDASVMRRRARWNYAGCMAVSPISALPCALVLFAAVARWNAPQRCNALRLLHPTKQPHRRRAHVGRVLTRQLAIPVAQELAECNANRSTIHCSNDATPRMSQPRSPTSASHSPMSDDHSRAGRFHWRNSANHLPAIGSHSSTSANPSARIEFHARNGANYSPTGKTHSRTSANYSATSELHSCIRARTEPLPP